MYKHSELKHLDAQSTALSIDLDSAPKTDIGAIDLTKAQRIAEGGTHILYRFPNAPFVIKLMKQNPNPKELEELEKKYAVLYDCFDKDGKQRCIREQHITLPVQLPGEAVKSSALSIVPYEKCFKSKVKFDFKIEPTELDPYLIEHHAALFDKANKLLIYKGDPLPDFNLNDYALIDARIGAILKSLDNDPELREVMSEFLNHYRDFYQKTNIILDAVGFENILFFKDDNDAWQFKVGSAIKHDTGKYTNELFADLHAGKAVDLTDFINFTHAYYSPGNIRAVNACAMKLNLQPVINDVVMGINPLVKLPQHLSMPERMLSYAQHGDFTTVQTMLKAHKETLSFNLRNFWAYSLIADEYIKHDQPLSILKQYLDDVSQLPVVLPEKEVDAKRVQNAKTTMVDRTTKLGKEIKDMQDIQDKKSKLHEELKAILPKFSIWSAITEEKKSQPQEVTQPVNN